MDHDTSHLEAKGRNFLKQEYSRKFGLLGKSRVKETTELLRAYMKAIQGEAFSMPRLPVSS